MSTAATRLARRGLDVEEVVGSLDRFYCYNISVSLWADAVANRLAGPALYLLADELAEVAQHAGAAATKLAARIGDLGGAVTADPGNWSNASPATSRSQPTAPIPARSSTSRHPTWAPSSTPTKTSSTRYGAKTTSATTWSPSSSTRRSTASPTWRPPRRRDMFCV